jgi:F-type H+-transporting ATPase subunit a
VAATPAELVVQEVSDMGGAGQAAAEGRPFDILEHLVDRHHLEVPFFHAPHGLDGRLELPHLPAFQLLGVTFDLSITRHVVLMWVASLLLVLTMRVAVRQSRPWPRGVANLVEPLVLFVRDEIVLANMGERGRAYLPYLLTAFFFILYCNLLGLFPYSATTTANISVTAALALSTFLVMVGSGVARQGLGGYLSSLVPAGVPLLLLPLMLAVELLGLITKPLALCVRLFANNIAGHALIFGVLGMVFVFRHAAVGALAVPFAVFVCLLEILVSFIQAMVFTLLSTLFIEMATHPSH